MLTPTLHKPIPMGTRVKIPSSYHEDKSNPRYGEVAGISFTHVIFGYIVILDEEINSEFGPMKAVVVNGPELEGENGENWRL